MPRSVAHRSVWLVLLAVFSLLIISAPAQAAFPGGNGKIAFTRAGDIYTMNPDGTEPTRITSDPAGDGLPAWSADGAKIAFDSNRTGDFEIYTMNADGSGVTRVTNNTLDDYDPAWSADGTKIAFAENVSEFGHSEIYTINADGSGMTNISNTPESMTDGSPSWSPDGTNIAFDRAGVGVGGDIYTMNPDGTGQVRLTDDPANDFRPSWSPDGTKIAFDSFRTGNWEIFGMNADGTGQTNITSDPAHDEQPAWSPDGTKIAFLGVPVTPVNQDIFTINADGTGRTNLTNSTPQEANPDWQPGEGGGGGGGTFGGYPRPKAASPFNAALVIAYKNCTTPNREHGPPLAHPSCSPPVQESDWLTTGTADSNGQATEFTGSARFRTLVGDPATPADEADVATVLNIADVRNKADLTDYTGEVEATAILRITDRFNYVTPGGGGDPATMVDIPFPVRASCAATADPAVGGTCAVSSSIDAVVPGAVKERQRAIWEVGAIQVYDGGADGINSTQPNTLFARQGVFVP